MASCPGCVRLRAQLDQFLADLEKTVPEGNPDHDGWSPRENLTAVVIHAAIDRLLFEVRDPFRVMAILMRSVMHKVRIEVTTFNAGDSEPAAGSAQHMTDEDLAAIPHDEIAKA